jgi:glycosyltransferase involved in cell wall biosynthesis
MNNPNISVITPSHNMLSYLKRCVASVADQKEVSVEHIIVDNMSDDGTVQWLKNNINLKTIIEPDTGMYEAINKGIKQSNGNIICYLNCDEQYLPNALSKVFQFFNDNKNIDVVYGDFLLVNEENKLISFKKSIKPRYSYILSNYLYTFTCSLFFRRNIFDGGHFYNTNYKTISDALFVTGILKEKYKFGHINDFTSIFTIRDTNLSFGSLAKNEQKILKLSLPIWTRRFNFVLSFFRHLENLLTGKYFHIKPIIYNLYVNNNLLNREEIIATQNISL